MRSGRPRIRERRSRRSFGDFRCGYAQPQGDDTMRMRTNAGALTMLAAGALLGYMAANYRLSPLPQADAAPATKDTTTIVRSVPERVVPVPAVVLAQAAQKKAAGGGADAKKPNILMIMGDDIGWFNPSCYHSGIMGYQTPNIDRIAKEGARFTDWYGQQSCTAGRAAFITGQSPIRTGLTKVGLPGADIGLQKEDPSVADFLKNLGYATGQFGKNHLGDKDEFLPTNHGFDEFFGNLYHLNAEEEPENAD